MTGFLVEIHPQPTTEGGPPGEIICLNKTQAERLAVGLPMRGRGSRGGGTGPRVHISQVGRRARERGDSSAAPGTPGVEGSEGVDGIGGESSRAGRDRGAGRTKRGGSNTETPIPEEQRGPTDKEPDAPAQLPPDIHMGGMMLTARDPNNPKPKQKQKQKKTTNARKTIDGDGEGSKRPKVGRPRNADSAAPAKQAGTVGDEAVEEDQGDGSAGRQQKQDDAEAGRAGAGDSVEEDAPVAAPASPLMEIEAPASPLMEL